MPGYVFDFDKHGTFDPDGRVDVTDVGAHNKELEAQEIAVWATRPDSFCGYIKTDANGWSVLTTWLGTELGQVYKVATHRGAVGNGSRITSYRIRGNNGASYYGKHGDMDLIRIRKMK